ncbi:Polyprotein P1234 [Frankliniella fusca]|uniref:Polyprotein P1234 n=1 Tax=Frankliniella fusca TaxID=407009 RepID=A0AAE1GTQ1_9NEOP|nr:Polyprotein P1234 [Frankliniella fusca]
MRTANAPSFSHLLTQGPRQRIAHTPRVDAGGGPAKRAASDSEDGAEEPSKKRRRGSRRGKSAGERAVAVVAPQQRAHRISDALRARLGPFPHRD